MSDLPPPTVPPTLDEVRGLLRPRISAIPTILAQWARGEGALADVPLLDPGEVAPRRFEELAGTVRVASTAPTHVTVGGLLEIPSGGILVTAVALGPADLSHPPDESASRAALAAAGMASEEVLVEVVALLSPIEDDGPAAGVGIVRPLVLADPARFPHPEDPTPHGTVLREAAIAAVQEDRDVVADLATDPFVPLPADLARIWGPLFAVARAATAGLAARGAGAA